MPPEKLLDAAWPFLQEAGLARAGRERLLPIVALEQEKYKLLAEVPRLVDFFFQEDLSGGFYDPKAVEKTLRKDGVGSLLEGLAALAQSAAPFSERVLEERIRAFCEERGVKTSAVFHPLRVAVSGRTEGPTLFKMLELLGRETVLARLRAAQELLRSRA